jgi:hypothetical protein
MKNEFKLVNQNAGWRSILFAVMMLFNFSAITTMAQQKKSKETKAPVIAALNAYSFSELLTARAPTRSPCP